MGKRWWLLVFALLLFLRVVLSVHASCLYCNGGVCDGVCEAGESATLCTDCTNAYCGNGHCDVGIGETCSSCPTDCGYCDGHSCTSYTQCGGGYCTCGLCASSPPSAGHCCSDADCDPDYYGPWGTNFCGTDANVYHSRTFHNNYCSSAQQCAQSTSTDTALVQTCTSGCSAGQCLSCTSHASSQCDAAAQKIFWYDSCGTEQDVKEDCTSETVTGSWGATYCKTDANVYYNKTTQYYGCSTGDTACHATTTQVIEQLVQSCTSGCTAGACVLGCSDAPNCTVHTNTGCSLDFVNRWWCADTNGDGCYEQTYATCTGGHCDAATHQCVAGCTTDASCDDNNPCTGPDTCTQATGVCNHPPLPTTQTCTTPQSQPGHCDGAGTCVANQCTPFQTRSCYDGPLGTNGTGRCQNGVQTCTSQGVWGTTCTNEVTPAAEACNGQDDNCNGQIDEGLNSSTTRSYCVYTTRGWQQVTQAFTITFSPSLPPSFTANKEYEYGLGCELLSSAA